MHCQVIDSLNTAAHHVCHKLRNDLLVMMSRFRNIRLVSSLSLETCPSSAPFPSPTLDQLKQHRADYSLNCSIQMGNTEVELFCTLTHLPSDELIWTNNLSLPAQPSQADMDSVFLQIAANTITLHSGKALSHWAGYQQSLQSPTPAHHQALVAYLAFLRDISRENFSKALDACEQRLDCFPDDSRVWVIFSRLCGYDHVLQYNLVTDLETRWTQAARMTMKLDPGGAESHSVFAHNSFLRGDYDLCRTEFETARKINPFDTSIEYLYGLGLYLMGDREAGVQAVNNLMSIPFTQPDWYHILPFLDAFNQGNYQTALALAERIQQFGYWGELSRSVSYFKLGQTERSVSEVLKLLLGNPHLLSRQTTDQRSVLAYEALKKLLKTLQEIKQVIPAQEYYNLIR